MKHILLISRCPPYPIHLGDRLIIWHLARQLSERGYVIDLLAFADRDEDWCEKSEYAQYFRHIKLFPEPARSQLDYLRRVLLPGARFPRRAEGAWSPEMWRAIEEHISATDYDVTHFFGGIQVYESRYAVGDVPAIITPYESYSLYLRRIVERDGGIGNRIQMQLARVFERFMFAPYRCTVVVSLRDKDELLEINPALNIEVIANGIDLEYFQQQNQYTVETAGFNPLQRAEATLSGHTLRITENTERESARLLFVGNYEYPPNIDAALRLGRDILPQVRQSLPDTKLWLVGNAPPPELLALGSDYVEVTGRVPDVRPYLAGATAFVCPLTLGAGIKNKLLEALAMGIPVVATPISVDGIAVQNGRDALIADIDGIADSVLRLLRDGDLQKTLSANGRMLIEERYSWAGVATAYEELYAELYAEIERGDRDR